MDHFGALRAIRLPFDKRNPGVTGVRVQFSILAQLSRINCPQDIRTAADRNIGLPPHQAIYLTPLRIDAPIIFLQKRYSLSKGLVRRGTKIAGELACHMPQYCQRAEGGVTI